MRAGGGADKGAEFERQTCRQLSLWVSDNVRIDLFSRNIMSGGRFTISVAKEAQAFGVAGDMRANHPLAYSFLEHFLVECKHYNDLGFGSYVYDRNGKSFLATVAAKARLEAAHSNVRMMLVLRQNRKPTLLALDQPSAEAALQSSKLTGSLVYHVFFAQDANAVYMFELEPFLNAVWLRGWLSVLKSFEG
jgi:hypothetical protein